MPHRPALPLIALLGLTAVPLSAQGVRVAGTITGKGDRPLAGALVVDSAALAVARSDSTGRFQFPATTADSVVLLVRAIGYRPARLVHRPTSGAPATIAMRPLPPQLSAVSVAASQYVASTERNATLTPLQVAGTPGANADVNRAVQTLPGVQLGDEGNGVSTRGGDITETRAFIDGAPLFTPVETVQPAGTIAATVDPFLLERIVFSAGGFDATLGNTLSGTIALQTQGRPERSYLNGNVTLAGTAFGGGLRLPGGTGVAMTIGSQSLAPFFALNGNPRSFEPAPFGGSASGSATWAYRPQGLLKLFALEQRTRVGVSLPDVGGDFRYGSARTTDVGVLSLRDSTDRTLLVASASTSGLRRGETFDAFGLRTGLRSQQILGRVDHLVTDYLRLRAGVEAERLRTTVATADPTPALTTQSDRAELRLAGLGEVSVALRDSLRLTIGARGERSGYARGPIIDPRVALTWMPSPAVALTGAWGWYSQLPDPTLQARLGSNTLRLPWQRAMHAILGTQVTLPRGVLRLEGWHKQWRNLLLPDRVFAPVNGLRAHATGADLLLRYRLLYTDWRLTWSGVRARRIDPTTGRWARSATDITHTATIISESQLPWRLSVNIGTRLATGRPFTPITGGVLQPDSSFAPLLGLPFGERLPPIVRTDISLSRLVPLGGGRLAVVFAGVGNLFNRTNVQDISWTRDFSRRRDLRSVFNRTLFIGANLTVATTSR